MLRMMGIVQDWRYNPSSRFPHMHEAERNIFDELNFHASLFLEERFRVYAVDLAESGGEFPECAVVDVFVAATLETGFR